MSARSLLGKTVRILIPLFLCLAAAELFIRLAFPAPRIIRISITTPSGGTYELSPDPLLFYVPRPGAGGFNEDGYRGRLYPRGRRPNSVRLVFVGDSVTEGVFVPTGERFTDIIDTRLGPDVEVINLGVPGYNLPQATEYLRTKALAYRPDIVFVGVSLDDEGRGPSNERRDLEKEMEKARASGLYATYRRAKGSLDAALLHLHAYRYLRILLSGRGVWGGPGKDGGRLSDDEIRSCLREMSRTADEGGFDLRLIFFAGANGIIASDIRRIAKEEGLSCFDLMPYITRRFDDRFYRMLLMDFGHFNRLGHKVVADMLCDRYNLYKLARRGYRAGSGGNRHGGKR